MLMESPLIQELMAKRGHRYILKYLSLRLGPVPRDVTERIEGIMDDQKLDELTEISATCADWDELRAKLPETPGK